MIQLESTINLNHLLQQSPENVISWLKNIRSGKEAEPQEFNWLGLAEAATFNAHQNADNQQIIPALEWAEVALIVDDLLSQKMAENQGKNNDALTISSMMLRAVMISKFGVNLSHPVLNINLIKEWFREANKNLSAQEISKITNWRDLEIGKIRELRQLKNRLKVIDILAKSDQLTGETDLKDWLSLGRKLP